MITALENHLWQSTLFCCVVAVLTLMLRRNRAAVRHGLWLAASVKFLIPFSLLVGIGSQVEWRKPPAVVRPQVSVVEQISQPFAPPEPAPLLASVPTAPSRLPAILFGLWLCGFAAQGFVCWRCWRQVHADLRKSSPLELGLPIPVLSTRSRLEPGVFGIFRQVLVLPEGITEQLTPAQFESVLAHELCHARRRDNLTAAVHMLVEALFWFHPLVWLIRVRLLEERERACDEEVLQAAVHPQDYAESIVAVCRYCMKAPLVCVSGMTGSNLKRRVEGIMMNRGTYSLNFGRRLLLAAAGCAAVVLPLATGAFHLAPVHAQQPAVPLEFEVATVKPSDPKNTSGTVVTVTPDGRFHAVNATLKDLIETAYDVRSFQIDGGPKWADSTKYDVYATPGSTPQSAAGPARWTDVRFEVQTLLKNRFQLQLHRETKTAPIYSLVIAKGGIKPSGLSATQNPQKGINASQGTMLGDAASMTQLSYKLSRSLQRPVVDNTGLQGNYDFKLEWTPDLGPSEADGPSLFSAIQEQLGLRLEATKGPVDTVVIDRVDRPSAN